MDKYDFINQLDEALNGKVSETERVESLQYYRQYIEEELARGADEAVLMEQLGSPYAIAKSIIDANDYTQAEEVYEQDEIEKAGSAKVFHLEGIKSWFVIAGIVLLIILILSVVFRIFTALLPVLIPFLIVMVVAKVLFGRR